MKATNVTPACSPAELERLRDVPVLGQTERRADRTPGHCGSARPTYPHLAVHTRGFANFCNLISSEAFSCLTTATSRPSPACFYTAVRRLAEDRVPHLPELCQESMSDAGA